MDGDTTCDHSIVQWENKPDDGLPPNKRLKPEDLTELLDQCFHFKYNQPGTKDLKKELGLIRNAILSGNATFGSTRMEVKRSWGKCLALMLDDIPDSLEALKILTKKLATGGGLF